MVCHVWHIWTFLALILPVIWRTIFFQTIFCQGCWMILCLLIHVLKYWTQILKGVYTINRFDRPSVQSSERRLDRQSDVCLLGQLIGQIVGPTIINLIRRSASLTDDRSNRLSNQFSNPLFDFQSTNSHAYTATWPSPRWRRVAMTSWVSKQDHHHNGDQADRWPNTMYLLLWSPICDLLVWGTWGSGMSSFGSLPMFSYYLPIHIWSISYRF